VTADWVVAIITAIVAGLSIYINEKRKQQ